jgi:hypothetical protein
VAGDPPPPSSFAARERAKAGRAGLCEASARFDGPAPGTAAALPEPRPAATVRPGRLGGDGRFEKFILALQALQIDHGAAESRTDRVERMRAAAEEIFAIDGVPRPVLPIAAPEPAPVAAADGQAHAARGAAVPSIPPGEAPAAPPPSQPSPADSLLASPPSGHATVQRSGTAPEG